MEITTSYLKTIYDRAIAYATAKYGSEPDEIKFTDEGEIRVSWTDYGGGELDFEYITAENLTADLDEVIKERAERLERERLASIERQRIENENRLIREKAERKAQYLRLQKEFGSDVK